MRGPINIEKICNVIYLLWKQGDHDTIVGFNTIDKVVNTFLGRNKPP